MPPALFLDSVDVLEVLPQQPRLPGTGLADHGDVPCATFARALLADVDDRLQLGVTPDERRLDTCTAPCAASAGNDAQRRMGAHGLLAALDVVGAGILVGDRGFARAPRTIVHENGSGPGQ